MAATTVYTTSSIVGDFLPASQTKVDSNDFTRLILQKSRLVDTRLAKRYVPFNDVAESTLKVTPVVIQDITTQLVAADALNIIMAATRNSEYHAISVDLEARASERLTALRDGDESIPEETVSSETLVKGTGGTYDIPVYEAFIAAGSSNPVSSGDAPTIIRTSVKVTAAGYTQYHLGSDFDIRWAPEHQKWVFTDFRNDFLSQSSVAKTITYDWSYLRVTDQRPGGLQKKTRKMLSVP